VRATNWRAQRGNKDGVGAGTKCELLRLVPIRASRQTLVKIKPYMNYYEQALGYVVERAIPASAPASDAMQYYGQVGDFFGGFWGTFISVVTLFFVYRTYRGSVRSDERAKLYQVFSEMLRSHEEIVSSISADGTRGREAFSMMLSEFEDIYEVVLGVDEDFGNELSMKQRINLAFLVLYYGTFPGVESYLASVCQKFPGGEILSRISRKKASAVKSLMLGELNDALETDKKLWRPRIKSAFKIVDVAGIYECERAELRELLKESQMRAPKHMSKSWFSERLEAYRHALEYSGHQKSLSNYFRNLYGAFTFIEEAKLSRREKTSMAKLLRSKLSNYEQALLALNSLTDQGRSWINDRLMEKYMPIKNIPEHFFSFDEQFDLKAEFPMVSFEWEPSPAFWMRPLRPRVRISLF